MVRSKGPNSGPTTASKPQSSTNISASSESKKSTTTVGFKERFRANHALTTFKSGAHPFANEAELTERLFRSRGSASPSRSEHQTIGDMFSEASNEREVEAIMTQHVLKPALGELTLVGMDYKAKFDKQWTAFPENVGFNNGLAPPKPDLTEGFARRTFPPTISSLGGCATLVKDDSTYVALPHFVAEFKNVGADMGLAEIQAGYGGAAMVYSHNQALAYLGQPDPPRTASVASVISNGLDWKVYAHYAHKNEKSGNMEWYQVRVAGGDITSYNDFKTTRTILRNTQDWGREQSADLRERLRTDFELNGARTSGLSSVAGSANDSRREATSRQPGLDYTTDQKSLASQAPSSRSDNAAASKLGTSAKEFTTPPPGPRSASSLSSNRGGLQPVSPPDRRSRAPPPSSKAEDAQRMPPPRAPASSRSASSGGSRPGTLKSTTSSEWRQDRPTADNANRHLPDDSVPDRVSYQSHQHDKRGPVGGHARDDDRHRSYRDRRPERGAIEPVQRRRSDSPQDRNRPNPGRAQIRDRIGNRGDNRGGSSNDSGSGSSTAGKVVVPPPPKPKGGIFRNTKKPKGQDRGDGAV